MKESMKADKQRTASQHITTPANQPPLKQNKKSTWVYIGYGVLGMVIFAIPSGLIAYYTKIYSIFSLGALGGALIFLTRKMNKDMATEKTQS